MVTPGEYKTILQLVAVMSHGKIAKRLTDHAIDLMQDVQNLRKAIYEYVVCLMLFLRNALVLLPFVVTSLRWMLARRAAPSNESFSISGSTTCKTYFRLGGAFEDF